MILLKYISPAEKLLISTIYIISIFLAVSCEDAETCEYESYTVLNDCPGFMQNGDFERVTGDPNTRADQDIDLAVNWNPLWSGSGSLADLFDDTSTPSDLNNSSFVPPTPASGVFGGIWIANNPSADATYREGMFNEMTATIFPNTGVYTIAFDYAEISTYAAAVPVKIGMYGIYHPVGDPLPAAPTAMSVPSNLDLFGSSNTVFLGEVLVTGAPSNVWRTATFTIDTALLPVPVTGFNNIMITNSHLSLEGNGARFMVFDNFCFTNASKTASQN